MPATLTFLGAAGCVTGSRYLLETAEARILLDCGMFQEREHLGLNWKNYGVDPARVDAVLLTHGHMDHCGWLPKLVKDGFRGKAYCTPATADLVPIILRDIAKIQAEDARTKAKRHAREGRTSPYPPVPLYDMPEAEQAIRQLAPIEGLDRPVHVAPGVTATWGENGHILGASWIAVEADGTLAVFSGDIGSWDRPILQDPRPPTKADYLTIESTYGDRVRPPGDAAAQLRDAVAEAAKRGGNLLIPSFSVERAQELLYLLSRLRAHGELPQKEVYLDSPMASRVTALFDKHPEIWDEEMRALLRSGRSPFSFPGLTFVESADESKRLNGIGGGGIIIAGNGMCTGGRIKHHLLHNLERPGATVLFVGYQAPGTLGRLLSDGAKEIRLFNKRIPVKAAVRQVNGLSGHADQNELLRWAGGVKAPPRRCFVTHGDPSPATTLAEKLGEKYGWKTETPSLFQKTALPCR